MKPSCRPRRSSRRATTRAHALLEPLLRPRAKEKLLPQQERDVVVWLSASYRFLEDDKAALPHAQREEALQQLTAFVRGSTWR
jgi:hypothetical protein